MEFPRTLLEIPRDLMEFPRHVFDIPRNSMDIPRNVLEFAILFLEVPIQKQWSQRAYGEIPKQPKPSKNTGKPIKTQQQLGTTKEKQ